MLGKQAKSLSDDNIRDLLAFTDLTRHPTRNRVIALLSAKAGLRAGEIANLTWPMVTDPIGEALSLRWQEGRHCITAPSSHQFRICLVFRLIGIQTDGAS